jgi:hypothetical protein
MARCIKLDSIGEEGESDEATATSSPERPEGLNTLEAKRSRLQQKLEDLNQSMDDSCIPSLACPPHWPHNLNSLIVGSFLHHRD